MFITRKSLSRRTVLRGLGAALSLPVLDAMVPALTALAASGVSEIEREGDPRSPHRQHCSSDRAQFVHMGWTAGSTCLEAPFGDAIARMCVRLPPRAHHASCCRTPLIGGRGQARHPVGFAHGCSHRHPQGGHAGTAAD